MLLLVAFLLAAPASHRDKALSLLAQGADDAALKELNLALKADPSDEIAHHELGKLLFKRGRMQDAIAQFEQSVKLDAKDAGAWYDLAYANRKAKAFEKAAEAYQRFTALSPEEADGYFGLAESLRELHRNKDAVTAYRAYVAKEKRASEAKWVEKAQLRIAELEEPEPVKVVVPAAAPASAPASAEPQVELVERHGTAPAAAEGGRKVLMPGGSQALVIQRNAPDAGEVQLVEKEQTLAQKKLVEGDKLYAGKELRAALFAYQDAVLAEPRNLEALLKVALVYAKMGHDDEAIEQWNKALAIDPQNRDAHDGIAEAQERRAARGPLAKPAVATPPLMVAGVDERAAVDHYTAGVELIRGRKYAEALAELDKAVAAKPGFAAALIARGSAHIGLAQYNESLADYSAAQKLDGSLAAPLFGLAESYRALGQGAKAAELYRAYAASTAPDAQESFRQYALQNAQRLSPR